MQRPASRQVFEVVMQASKIIYYCCSVLLNTKCSFGGILLSTLLANYGFSQGDEFKVSCLEEGKIVLEKKK
jgi:hypothetical protein